jgi:lipoate-protein ligase A
MHGEYKPPGGKLVAADVEVSGGRLARVQVSGDFSLEPGHALGRLNAALTGIPVIEDAPGITARITAALGDDAVLAGFTAGAVATAVRRALTRASGWYEHDWRFVREEPQDPALHMALDEVLAREVAVGRRPPTLRVWEWSAPAVVIGSFQSLRNEVDAAEAITYSLYAPDSLVAGMSIAESYRYLDDWVIGTLTGDLGLSARYEPLNDIASARGKIGGAAQRRLAGGTVLHHVTMAYDIDADAMTRVLRTGREKLSDKGIPSAVKRVDPLRRQTRLTRAEVIDALADHFRRRYGLTPDTVTGGELRAARDLARVKFASSEWTARVP